MQEQEQGLEKKERTVYLSSTGDFVNTDLTNPREIKYASEIQLYNQSRDKFYGLKPMSATREEITKAALEDAKRGYLRQVGAGLASAGVQMGQEIYNFAAYTNPILVAKTKRLFLKRNIDVQKKYGVIGEEAYKRQLEELNAEYRGVRDTLNADLMAQREKQIAYLEKTGLGKRPEDSFVYDIANGVGSAAAALGLAIITKSPNAAAVMFGTSAGQSGYEEALENGIAPEKALKVGAVRGGFESILERVGLHCAFESLAARGVLARIGKTAITEGVQEMSQQTAEEILQTKYGGRKEDFKTAVNNIIMSGFVGGLVGGGFGAVGAGRSAKQGLKDTGKVEIKSPYSITLEDAYFSGVKNLTDLGMPPEEAEKLTYSLLKKAAAPETIKEIQDMINEENSNLTYLNNDEDQNAAAVKAAVAKATAPDRVVREQAFNIADKVEEQALAAGRAPEEAAASAEIAQAGSIGIYELTGVLPKDQYEINIEAEKSTENDLSGQEDTSFDVSTFNQAAAMYRKQANDLSEFRTFAKENQGNIEEDNKSFYQFETAEGVKIDVPFERVLHIDKEHNLTDKQLNVVEKELKSPEYAVLLPGVGEYNGRQVKLKFNTSLGKAGAVIEIVPSGRVFLNTAFFDSDVNIDNWAKENLPNTPSKKPVFIGGGNNSIADIVKKVKGQDTFYQEGKEQNQPVDLTNIFSDIAKLPKSERQSKLETALNDLIGKEFPTATEPLRVQITSENKPHIIGTNLNLSAGQEKRHLSALKSLEQIIRNAVKIDKDGSVDLSHNTGKKTLEHKKKVVQYVYFESPVKIGDDAFVVELSTEQVRGQDEALLDLYHIRVKRKSHPAAQLSTLQGGSYVNSIADTGNKVKGQDTFYQEEVKKIFSPNNSDVEIYNNDLQNALSGKLDFGRTIRVGETPFIYTKLGLKKLPLRLPVSIIQKSSIDKHNVPLEIIDNLPKLIADPVMVLKSKTIKDNLVAFINAKDSSNRPVMVVLKPVNGKINIIPSIYGKDNFENFIKNNLEAGNILYVDKNKASVYARPNGLQLPKGSITKGSTNSILTKEQIVKTQKLNQDEIAPRGSVSFADDIKQAFIRFNETSDKSTLIHELAHIWLKDIERFAQISTNPDFAEFKENLDTWLGEPVNGVYTVEQQEKFAKTFELYMQEGKAPNAELQGVFEKFKAWLREIYGAVKQYIELTPEAIKTFDTLLASEKGSYNIDKIRNKTAQAKAVVEKIKKGQAVNIDGVNIRDIKEALKVMRARIPAAPKENLLRTLRSKGADYDNAAKIDKEAYKNARVPNKKSGIQDNLALTLRDWGYMAFDDSAVADYNGLSEQNEIAADLIDRALNGEKIYKVGDQQAAKREHYFADVEAAREIVGEDSAEIARAITDLEKKGYRVVEKADIDYLEKQLNQLDKIAEKARLLEQNTEEQKKSEAFDKMQKQNALEARRIKAAVIEELEKRDLAGKDKMFEALEKAQTPDEIFTAAADVLMQLEKEFANTEEGQAEQRKIDVPSTNWEAKRITLLKDLAEISQNASQAEARAREITNQAHLANQGLRPALTKEEKAELEKAKTLLKKNFEKKYLKAFNDALSGEPHIESKDVAKIMKVLANNAMEMRLVSDSVVRQFIRIAQEKQTANYKKYLSGKISALLNSKLYSKVGQLRRAKFTPEIMEFMTQAKEIWGLTNKEALQKYDERAKAYNPENVPSPVEAFENRLLEFKALWEKQNPADAKGLYDELLDLVRGDRTLKQFEEAKRQFNESGRRLLLTQALKERTLPTGTATYLLHAGTDLQSALDTLFGKSLEYETMGFDGQMHKETFNAREEFAGEIEQIEEQNFLYGWNKALDEAVREAYGLETQFQMFDKIKELQDYKKEFINFGFVKKVENGAPVASIFRNGKWVDNNKPRTQTLNKLNIIYNYIQSQNHEYVETAEGSKDVGYAARLLRSYGKEQLAEMFDCLTAEDKKLADNLIKLASKFYPELNKVHKRIYGFALPKTEGVYFPGVTERIADDVDWHADFVANSKSPYFIKNRVKSDKPIMAIVNPLAVLKAHGQRSAEFIYNAERFTELKRLFKAEEMKTAFVEKFGQKDGVEIYQKMLRLIDLQGPQKAKAKGEFFKVSEKIFNNWVKTAMGIKIMTGIKQVASGISFAEKMPSLKFTKYLAEGMAHPLETMDYMYKVFPYIETRFESGGMNEAMARAMARNDISAMGEKFNLITNLGLLNTRYGDKVSISLFGYPYYKYLTEDLKMPPEQAKAEFLRQATTTLQSSLKSQLSEAQAAADSLPARVFMVFRNQQLQYVRKAWTTYAQFRNGEISAQQFAKAEFIYLVLNPLVYVALGIGLIPKDDDDKKRLASAPLVQTLGAYPFGEATAEFFVDNVFSLYKDKKLTAPQKMGLPMFDDIIKDVTRAIKTINAEDITAEDYVDTIIGVAKYSGLPLNTLKAMIKGGADIAEGKAAKGALEMLGYTENRAGKITGDVKKKKKRKSSKKRKKRRS